jgi:tRNA modification GTPase
MPLGETIAAAATPSGESALALVRASGPLVPALAATILGRPAAQTPTPRHATFGHYHTLAGESLDQIVLTHYAAPNSATGEDLLEIACHGNPLIVRHILEDLFARGCRPAQPGEFTRTAFLAGKLDLSQAEAVADLIRARSDGALRAARRQLDGELSRRVQEFSATLLSIQAEVEAYIDFPEEDLPAENSANLQAKIAELSAAIEKLLATARYGALLRDGASAVIAGPPNAGKSSLLNALLGRPRAIVSPEPGTTRDFLEERFHAGPYVIQITDTAGLPSSLCASAPLRELPSQSAIEIEGINRSLEKIATADFLLLVIDSTLDPPTLPQAVLDAIHPNNALIIENKTDLSASISRMSFLPDCKHVRLSTKTGDGLDALRTMLVSALEKSCAIPHDDLILTTARHTETLQQTQASLHAAQEKLKTHAPAELLAAELLAAHLRDALNALGEILGRVDNEAMLDQLFAKFCIGK